MRERLVFGFLFVFQYILLQINCSYCLKHFFGLSCNLIRIKYTVFPRRDASVTIYFGSTAMRRLFESDAYSRVAFNFVTGAHV